MTVERLARGRTPTVIFGVLVVATVGAFFVTQRLKRSTPVVRKITLQLYISPNHDGRKDKAKFGFRLPKAAHMTVSITDANDDVVRTISDKQLSRGRHDFKWNGRDSTGRIAPDGFYYLRVVNADEGRGLITRRAIKLVTTPPPVKLLSVKPNQVTPGARTVVKIEYAGSSNPKPLFTVYRTDLPGKPRVVRRFNGTIGSNEAVWDERLQDGRPAPQGTYAIAVTVQNKALVAGSSPKRLPPTAKTAEPGNGVTIGGPAAAPPLTPVRAGYDASIGLTGAIGRVRWKLRSLDGSKKPLAHGTGHAPVLRVPIPRKTATGVYVVRVRGGRGTATVPLAVRRGGDKGRVLVVLPAMTWQGLNPVDVDRDGFPDTLEDTSSVALSRPFASGRPPAGFTTEVAPLLRFLDASKLPYELTTDIALDRGDGPRFEGRPGVVFAGSERWLTESLAVRLHAYAEGGGRVASFGTDAFRRLVVLTPTDLSGPGPARTMNALGERTAPSASAAAPLVVNPGDTLGLFAGTDGFVGLFTRFEQSEARASGTTLEASAGRDPEKPAFVAYKLGEGTVIRAGTPQWSGTLASDPEVANVTRNVWSFLSR